MLFMREKMAEKDFHERTRPWCRRFGGIAVEKGFVTEQQVKEALAEQEADDVRKRPHRLIGEILFHRNWMTWEQIDEVLKELFKDKAEAKVEASASAESAADRTAEQGD
jgi:transcriptional/translational regulatory protein YebC/TACO1